MTEQIKLEVSEQLELDIKFGFENQEQLFDSIRDMFYGEEDFDENWLRETIAEKYKQYQIDSSGWKRPTDFERLAETFDELIKEKIVCLHNAGYTKSDGEGDCMEAIERLNELGVTVIGFCYYLHRTYKELLIRKYVTFIWGLIVQHKMIPRLFL